MTEDKTDQRKILHLTLKKKWFQMIASGEKKEELETIIKTYKYYGT